MAKVNATGTHISFKRGFALSLAAMMSLSLGLHAAYADPSDDEVNKAKSHEKAISDSVSRIEAQLAAVNAKTQDAQQNAMVANYAYNDAISQLTVADQNLVHANSDAKAAKQKLSQARVELGNLARTIYTSQGSLTDLSVYIHTDGLQTVAMRKVAIDLFGANADKKLKNYENLNKVVAVIVKKSEAARADKAAAVKAVAKQKAHADAVNASYQREKAKLSAERESVLVKLAEARGVTLQAEKARQKKIEADRKAAQEAAQRKALEEATKHSQAKPKPNAPSPTTPKPGTSSPAPVATPSAPPVVHDGSRGSEIVAYAKQFLGVPYVWGGSTPAGFDCSGLTSYVFRHFGINLPRIADAQANVGYRVSASEAMPGDMVNYGYHVGIYIGKGYMIHAPMPGMNVEISPVWGNPVYVRAW